MSLSLDVGSYIIPTASNSSLLLVAPTHFLSISLMVAQTLRGELVIEHLERVENLMEAKEALISKRNLHSLALASWMSASVLRTMIILYLHDCTYCLHLSQLAQLPCLKYLSLR